VCPAIAATAPRSLVLRLALGALAAAGLAAAVLVAGPGSWQPWVFLVLPDVALLAGVGGGLEPGRLHPRAVGLYNALHVFAGPALLGVASLWLGPVWLGGALAWAAHVLVDRAAGYGLRDRAGFIRGR